MTEVTTFYVKQVIAFVIKIHICTICFIIGLFLTCYSSSMPVCNTGYSIEKTPVIKSVSMPVFFNDKFQSETFGTEQKAVISEGNAHAILAAPNHQLKVNEYFSKSRSDISVRYDYVKSSYVDLPPDSNRNSPFIDKCKGRSPPER